MLKQGENHKILLRLKKLDSSFAVQKQQRIRRQGLGLFVNHVIFKIHTLTLLKILLFAVIQQ